MAHESLALGHGVAARREASPIHCRVDGATPDREADFIVGRAGFRGCHSIRSLCSVGYRDGCGGGAEVVLEVQPELVRLFKTVEGVSAVFARGGTLPRVDYQASLLDLRDVFCTDLSAIPNTTPYVHVERSVEKLEGDRPKIGLCWAGNPSHDNDRNRSIDLTLLEPLLDLQGIDFFSLQVGSRAGEAVSGTKLRKLPGELGNFLDTAQFVVELDVVITVDSSIAHLAGALGQAVWVLLPYALDWRCLLGREDSPWYPGTLLFRQVQPGDWSVPVKEFCKKSLRKL